MHVLRLMFCDLHCRFIFRYESEEGTSMSAERQGGGCNEDDEELHAVRKVYNGMPERYKYTPSAAVYLGVI